MLVERFCHPPAPATWTQATRAWPAWGSRGEVWDLGEGPVILSSAGFCQALGAVAEESGRSRKARPAAGLSVTPPARGGGLGDSPAAGWDPGLVSCLEGKGPAEGSRASSSHAHPCASLSFSSLLLEKRGNCEPRVGLAGWGPALEGVTLGVGPHYRLTPLSHSLGSSLLKSTLLSLTFSN